MKHLVLLGAGHAHVQLLASLAAQPLAGVQVTLLAPYPRQLYSGMVPGFVAGHYTLEDCVIRLAPLLASSGVRWLQRSATALDADARTVTLDDGSTLTFDLMSVNSGAVQDRQKIEQQMPGASAHALFVRPIETFGAQWPQVVARVEADRHHRRIGVIGGGAAGIELACAAAHRLPGATVSLLCGNNPVGANYPSGVQARIRRALAVRGIQVLQDRANRISATDIGLASGGSLACDVALIAIGAQAPAWLQGSGLTLDAEGFIAVDAIQRATHHPHLFAVGDVSSRVDRPLPRSGVYAVRAGVPLADNLRAVLSGRAPRAYHPPDRTLNLLSCGDRYAIASWGPWSAQGRWVWWLKDRIDRGFIRTYSPPEAA